jgi:hypothetical protein
MDLASAVKEPRPFDAYRIDCPLSASGSVRFWPLQAGR